LRGFLSNFFSIFEEQFEEGQPLLLPQLLPGGTRRSLKGGQAGEGRQRSQTPGGVPLRLFELVFPLTAAIDLSAQLHEEQGGAVLPRDGQVRAEGETPAGFQDEAALFDQVNQVEALLTGMMEEVGIDGHETATPPEAVKVAAAGGCRR
jgi:hypothetical protein